MKDKAYNQHKKELSDLHKKGYKLYAGESLENYDHETGEFFIRVTVDMVKKMKCPKGFEE